MLRVLIADDHVIVRKGLREILREAWANAEVGEAANGPEALEQVALSPWDVLILDITMPGMTGLAVLRHVKTVRPGLPVLMLSMHNSYHYVALSFKNGAAGYLSKEAAPDQLLVALNTVLSGARYLDPALTAGLDPGDLR